MKLKLIITSNIKDIIHFNYNCDEHTLVENMLETIYNKYFNYAKEENVHDALLPHFNFINGNIRQKAKLDFKLLEFLNNFNYDLNNSIHLEFLDGIGGGFGLEDIAEIRINGGEPHAAPHVHVYPGKKTGLFVRIVLSTMTQMKNDVEKFSDLFNSKERKEIIKFLKENKDKLEEIYTRTNKGEYITERYILTYNGEDYTTYSFGKYN